MIILRRDRVFLKEQEVVVQFAVSRALFAVGRALFAVSGTLCRKSGTPARQKTAKSGHPTFRNCNVYHNQDDWHDR